MEDLKKIQEFFSKPIKENSRKSPDFILTEPAEIKYTESFGTGIKAPGVLHHANEGVFLGAEGAYIIVLPGGTFYVDEDKEEAMPIWPLKDQDQALHFALDYTPFSPKFETWKSWIKRPNVLDEEEIDEYNSGIYYDPAKERNAVKAKEASKSALERVKDMIKKIAKEQIEEAKPKKGHGEKISKEVFAKLKGKTINYKGHDYKVVDSDEAVLTLKDEDGKSKTINLRQFNISGMIDEIMETIELGKNLNEELCAKGKAYRKKRMAAGEKSSAYLNGRAVKVCKGQMKG